jgi:hypothetical protein
MPAAVWVALIPVDNASIMRMSPACAGAEEHT